MTTSLQYVAFLCSRERVSQLHVSAQMSATILDVDRIIMPVHLGIHWTCAVIDLAAKELVYYDSMGVRPYLPKCL